MEKIVKSALAVLAIAFFLSGCSSLGTKGKIKEHKLIEAEEVAEGKGIIGYILGDAPIGEDTIFIETEVEVEVPLLQKIADSNWQLFASWAYRDGENRWVLVSSDDYSIKTETKEASLIGLITIPSGIKEYWPRIWGQELNSGEWLYIDEGNMYARDSISGRPAYEFLGDTETKEKKAVPDNYQKRP
ncbi:MAG: hypothetical protein AVO34_02040 [Firmicutes bacterium ML8_F2]|jgi:hypothetical protein|nr:MAG: hypothetical protein AVO34_02040 [Firmicutes bacterium ML8_F2]